MVVDPEGLAALMNWTGDISPDDVEGLDVTLTPENTAHFLEYDQYVDFQENSDRVDFLEDVAHLTFDRLTTETQMPSPRRAVEILDPIVDNGHIQFTTFDDEEAGYFRSIGLQGNFYQFGQSPLGLVTSNAAGNKIDYFLQRSMRFDGSYNMDTGAVSGKVQVTLTNAATLDQVDYMIGNEADDESLLPRGTNRSFVSIYSPLDLRSATINGQPADLQREIELGTAVYSTFVDIPAGGTVSIELDVQGTATSGGWWLAVPPQPMVTDDQLELNVTVDGESRFKVRGEKNITRNGRQIHFNGPLDHTVQIAIGKP